MLRAKMRLPASAKLALKIPDYSAVLVASQSF